MNHKQKLGYMALGAGILAVGIIIGQVITPNIEAQQNGFFDTITCRELKVVDKNGKTAIRLSTFLGANGVSILDKNEKGAIVLSALEKSNEINIYDKNRAEAIALRTGEGVNNIAVKDPEGKESFRFNAQPHRNDFIVYDKSSGAGIGFYSDSNEAKQTRWSAPKED